MLYFANLFVVVVEIYTPASKWAFRYSFNSIPPVLSVPDTSVTVLLLSMTIIIDSRDAGASKNAGLKDTQVESYSPKLIFERLYFPIAK